MSDPQACVECGTAQVQAAKYCRVCGHPRVGTVAEWVRGQPGLMVNDEQAIPLAAGTKSNIQVVARAGSGKTGLLVARTLVLLKMLRFSADEILLLAFNKNAALELQDRLKEHVGDELPHVMTFDALNYALVQPEQALITDDDQQQQIAGLQSKTKSQPEQLKELMEARQDLMQELIVAAHLPKWNEFPDIGFDWHQEANNANDPGQRNNRKFRTFQASPVKSRGEETISNLLFLHGVDYEYEEARRLDDRSVYRPDFTIPTGEDAGVIIEYFGLLNSKDYPKYARAADRKRKYWKEQPDWDLVELTPADLKKGQEFFTEKLLDSLNKHGVKTRRRTVQDVFEDCTPELRPDDYAQPIAAFINQLRNQAKSPSELRQMIEHHNPSDDEEKAFLNLVEKIFAMYLTDVIGEHHEDFNGLAWRAVQHVTEGRTQFIRQAGEEKGDVGRFKCILIDEFQDFSKRYHAVIDAIQTVNPEASVFCVGDDWQAINRFAGSDLQYFHEFSRYFDNKPVEHHALRLNYRSDRSIVGISNVLMAQDAASESGGEAASEKPGQVRVWSWDEFNQTPFESLIGEGSAFVPAIARLVRVNWLRNQNTVVLSRTNRIAGVSLDDFQKTLQKFVPADAVSCSTVHSYKGLETDAVIVWDVVEAKFPLRHPHRKFQRILGDTDELITDNERQLFYVALTRAKHTLDLLTYSQVFDQTKAASELTQPLTASRFLGNIRDKTLLVPGDWKSVPSIEPQDEGDPVFVEADGYDQKHLLREDGFVFNKRKGVWVKTIPRSPDPGNDYSYLKARPWAQAGASFRVFDMDGRELYRG